MTASALGRDPVYVEHRPHSELLRHVECYWSIRTLRGPAEEQLATVLPDGCMDIIFDLGDDGAGAPIVVGTMTRPIRVRRNGHTNLLGVRFRPGAARPFLPADARELTDASTELDDLWGAGAGELQERLAATGGQAAPVTILDEVLLRRLGGQADEVDEPVLRASELATATRGRATVEAMAEAAGLGRRQLERRFLATVGISPKTACRVVRFRRAVDYIHAHPSEDLSRVAHATGYADQPHFSREFRSLASTTPGRYRAELSQILS